MAATVAAASSTCDRLRSWWVRLKSERSPSPRVGEAAVSVEAIVIRANGGKALSLRGTQVAYKAEGERPGGGPTVLEFTAAPGFGTGDHVHSRLEEIFYIIEGEFQIRAGDKMLRAKAGDFVLVPPGVPHGFANPGEGPAKMVLVISPGGPMSTISRSLPSCWRSRERPTSKRSQSSGADTTPSRSRPLRPDFHPAMSSAGEAPGLPNSRSARVAGLLTG